MATNNLFLKLLCTVIPPTGISDIEPFSSETVYQPPFPVKLQLAVAFWLRL